jgi:hypothetical protein
LKREILKEIPPIPDCKFPLTEIYQAFTDRSSLDDPDTLWLLTRLFFAIASQDAFVQLQAACVAMRNSASLVLLSSTNTVSANMQSLDRLDTSLAVTHIIKRFYLVRLVDYRVQLEQNHRPRQTTHPRKAKGGREQQPRARAASQALFDMMAEAYPELKRGTDGYTKRLTTLKNRLSKGRNWHTLASRFDTAILALVPTEERFQFFLLGLGYSLANSSPPK